MASSLNLRAMADPKTLVQPLRSALRAHRRRSTSPSLRGGGQLRLLPLGHTEQGVAEFTPARAVRSLRLRGRATRAAVPSGAAGHAHQRPPRATVRFLAAMSTRGLPHTGRTSVRAGTPRPAGAPPAPQGHTAGSTPRTPRTSRTSRATQSTSTCMHVQMCHGLFAIAPAQCTAARRNVALRSVLTCHLPYLAHMLVHSGCQSPDSIHASESHTYEQTSEGAGHSSRPRRAPAVVWSAAPL